MKKEVFTNLQKLQHFIPCKTSNLQMFVYTNGKSCFSKHTPDGYKIKTIENMMTVLHYEHRNDKKNK